MNLLGRCVVLLTLLVGHREAGCDVVWALASTAVRSPAGALCCLLCDRDLVGVPPVE